MLRRTGRLCRWLSIGAVALVLGLWAANRPFYTGSTMGSHLSWRLEHGRLNLFWRPSQNPESFYIAVNAGPPLWAWDGHFHARDDWFLRIPLWTPFLLAVGWAVLAWLPPRVAPGHCRCGYSLKDLPRAAPCPECGWARQA